ncbi:MAG: tetratricopeptide repeat protein [Terrimicrobiaceae bacterium]
MTATPIENKPSRFPPGFWPVLVCIGIALALLGADSWARYAVIDITLNDSLGQPLPALSQDSPTGFEGGMRRVILPMVGADGYQWIMHTQKLLHDGGWRIRFTDQDNAPYGREIHWSHSFIWWLIGVGQIHSWVTGWPLPASVEAVSPYANTLLLVFLVLTLPWLVLRKLGSPAACALALGLTGTYLFYEFFMVGYPDHHGIAAAAALMCALFLAFAGGGWVSASSQEAFVDGSTCLEFGASPENARWWFGASALAGAVALWISAATAVPVFAGIGLGALVSLAFWKKDSSTECYLPNLWRLWGIVGCAGSLFFYLLEYFPSHMGMRLEVNHPLYALAWLCAGELLARLARWRAHGVRPWTGRWSVPLLIFLLAGLSVLPILIKLDPARFFVVSDSFLWQLHRDHIGEFKSIFRKVGEAKFQGALVIFSIIPLLGIFVLRFLALRKLGPSWKAMLLLTLLPAVLLTLLGIYQVRWLGIATALWLAVLPVWVSCALQVAKVHRFAVWERLAAALFFLVLIVQYPQSVLLSSLDRIGKAPSLGPGETFNLVVRDLAYHLRRQAGDKEVVVLSGPTTTTWLMFYGGLKGLGTLYWENTAGLKSAAAIYAAPNETEAVKLIKQHKVTHVVIFSVDAFSAQYVRLARNLPPGSEPMDAFAQGLLYNSAMPRWLTPIHYRLPDRLRKEWVAIAEVVPEQTTAEASLAFGRYLASRGNFASATEHFRRAVELNPDLQEASLELAALLFLEGSTTEAESRLESGLKGASPDKISEVCFSIATYCQDAKKHAAAVSLLRRGVAATPAVPSLRNLLAWLLATSKDDAVRQPEEALLVAVTNLGFLGEPVYWNTLAAAQASTGAFSDAIQSAKQAVAAARKAGEPEPVVKAFEERLKLYEEGKPYRE